MDCKDLRVALFDRKINISGRDISHIEDLRRFSSDRGWTATEYTGIGHAGTTIEDPAFDRLLTDARQGRFNVLAVYHVEHLCLGVHHLLLLLSELRKLSVGLIAIGDNLDTTNPFERRSAGTVFGNVPYMLQPFQPGAVRPGAAQ